jgi:hypothetical protein
MENTEIAGVWRKSRIFSKHSGESLPRPGVPPSSSDHSATSESTRRNLAGGGRGGLARGGWNRERLATSLQILVTTGRLPMLDRLRGETDPVALLESVPGIGRALAERLHRDFEIDSLEDLEVAAHDGRQ